MSHTRNHFFTGLLALLLLVTHAHAWWDKEWSIRKKITADTSEAGVAIASPIGQAAVLVRLHDGNYQFISAKEDGSDIRFVAEDDKTLLPFHIEKYDSLLNEAFVWVQVPEIKAGGSVNFWLYYGNIGEKAVNIGDPKGTYDADTVLVYHFSEKTGTPSDSSASGITGEGAAIPVEGGIIGSAIRLTGINAITIAAAETLNTSEGGALTWSAWIKPATLAPNAVIYSRRDGDNSLIIGLNDGVPYVEVGGSRSETTGSPLAVNVWRHLAIVAAEGTFTLFLDGENFGTLSAPLPALTSAALLGRDGTAGTAPALDAAAGFNGELDELTLSKVARPAGFIQFQAISQSGTDRAGKLLALAPDEVSGGGGHSGGSAALEHVLLFGDIAKNMMFDGWIAVGVCVLMIIFGWGVAIQKFGYLNSIQKGSDSFLKEWKQVSSDLTALDHDDSGSAKTFGGKVTGKALRNIQRSPLYHLYHIGSEEISHRLGNGKDRSQGLSARSIQAIRASLETGLVLENQRLNKGLIFLTISIAGGPYVGLLGTVVGVMITFAIIAKTGEVEVNSIAPGIASALLATVAGLIVAIPALFIYSYLSSRIKDLIASMQVFIDEFIAKMAEFYPTPSDRPNSLPPPEVSSPSTSAP